MGPTSVCPWGKGVHDDELLALSYDYLYALGSRGSTLGGQRRFVYRGPTNRGQIRMQHVAVSSMTDEANYTDSSAGGIAFAGYEQGDVAALVTDGHLYRCNVWNDVGRNRILARIVVELEHGQDVVIVENVIATGTEQGPGDTGTRVDCPRVIAVGSTFVAHWLEADVNVGSVSGYNLWRATLNMNDIDSSTAWVSQGSIATHIHGLYDAQPLHGSTTEFVVVHKWTTGTDVQVRMHNGFAWGNTLWNQLAAVTIAARVLCCSGSRTDDQIYFSYQVGAALWTGQVLYSTGLGFAQVQTFTSAPYNEFGRVAHERITGGQIAVVAEGWETEGPSSSHHGVAARRIVSTPLRAGNEHWTHNLSLISRPFAYQSARSLVY